MGESERINLYSDTQTRPTPAMREAMARAEVGDEQRGEDPTTNALCERVAALLGKEEAIYLPSGAMCNLVALKTHTQAGDAVICERECHIIRAECGGAGLVSGVIIDPIDSPDGIFTWEQLASRIDHLSLGVYAPPPRLVCVENTHNFAGGTIWGQTELAAVADYARGTGLATHMDGARLLNASVARGVEPGVLCNGYDSVWIDFSKGLGAPVGAALAGSRELIARARRYKQMFGGGMRQSGIIAAGALYALEHHVDRLAEDHAHATLLADAIEQIEGLALIRRPQSNIVFFTVTRPGWDGQRVQQALKERRVELSLLHGRLRAVTHLDVDRAGIERAADALRTVMK